MDKIAVLIPCYNESLTIAKVVSDFNRVLPEAVVYVYDNNSTDDSVDIVIGYAGQDENRVILGHENQQGKGFVIRRMFQEIEAECYLLVDGDDTYPAEAAADMCHKVLEERFDMVIGDRLSTTYYQENKRAFHNTGNALIRVMINRLFNCRINDVLTGYRAFSYRFVKSFPVLSRQFEVETEMTIHAAEKKLSVINVPVAYRDRQAGSVSKLNTLRDGVKVIFTVFKLYKNYKPLQFFCFFALLFFALALGFFIPLFLKYLETRLVLNMPTLVVCGFTVLASFLRVFAGLILSTIHQKNLQDFEWRLLDIETYLSQEKTGVS